MNADPEQEKFDNRRSRQVRSGHYVECRPTPLPSPKLVHASKGMAAELGLQPRDLESEAFLRYFSGDIEVPGKIGAWGTTWATPYALSIYGRPMIQNCPFQNDTGYGDGRAISVGEVVTESGKRYEMQLKGAGKTPFCRGGDGRAVLRSSVREFLASEAMHSLGVPTTRALSLIVSGKEVVKRPWYSGTANPAISAAQIPAVDDPRLAHIPEEHREALIEDFVRQIRAPDVVVNEKAAITCRVAPSFLRVGHVELFSRRVKTVGSAPARRA